MLNCRILPLFVVAAFASFSILSAKPVFADDTLARLEEELQIVSVPLVAGADGARAVSVQVRVQSRCIFGDFEALLSDMLHSESPLAILTLEPILPRVNSLVAATALIRKPETLIDSGFSAQLPVGNSSRTQFLAVSLCKDSKLKQSCRDKEFVSINSILSEYQKPRSKTYNPPDRVYTYGFVLIRDGRAYSSRSRFAAALRPKWHDYLQSVVGPDPDFEESFELFWKRVSALEPYPIGASSTALVLTLPRYDAKKCGHQS